MSAPVPYPCLIGLIGASWRIELHEPAVGRDTSPMPKPHQLVSPVCDLASDLVGLIGPG